MAVDLYEVLGLERGADDAAVKKAYKRLAMRYHPDRNQSADAERKFKEVQQAYTVLSDPERRDTYDRFGTVDPNTMPPGGPGFEDLSSLFGGIFRSFGGGGPEPQAASLAGRTLRVTIELTLEDAVAGVERSLTIPMSIPCGKCDGSGARDERARKECPACDGQGVVANNVAFLRLQETCRRCKGMGEVITDPCKECRGGGVVRDKRTVKFKVPAGLDDGDTLRVRGQGEPGRRGAPAGDLLVQVRLLPHKVFTRAGDNLLCEMPITFAAAALGDKVTVPTLDGPRQFKIEAGTQSGHRFKIKGAGIKGMRSSTPGDLILTVVVETPQKLTSEQARKLREFDEALAGHGRHTPTRAGWFDRVKAHLGK